MSSEQKNGSLLTAHLFMAIAHETLIIGCGNLLRGDDSVGPLMIRRLWELGLPEGVFCVDGGTAGMDVAFQTPVFAAQIAGNIAETTHQLNGPSTSVATLYRQAIEVLRKTALDATVATLNLNLGICYQEMSQGNRGALLEAVKQYQEALKFFTRESTPEEDAFTHNNLALAYLSVPLTEASDTLRVAIAIQSLREALKIYRKETHPELWASTQLNLANALQYAPCGHVEENLMEAVNLYDEILSIRQPTENPIGYARLLANQGNALAHLGVFDHALPKLTEARDIFTQLGETDSAESINEVIREIGDRSDQTKAAGTNE